MRGFNSSFRQSFPSDSAILMAFSVALLSNNMEVSSNPSLWAKRQGVNKNAKAYIKHQRIIQFRKINIVEVDLFKGLFILFKSSTWPCTDILSGIKFETIYKMTIVWGFRGSSLIDTFTVLSKQRVLYCVKNKKLL